MTKVRAGELTQGFSHTFRSGFQGINNKGLLSEDVFELDSFVAQHALAV